MAKTTVVLVTRTGPSAGASLNFKLFDFNGTWSEKWSATCRVQDLRNSYWWTANWQVKISGSFFLIAVDTPSVVSGDIPLIVHRDPTNTDRWLTWGKLPTTSPGSFKSYHNFYRDQQSWPVQIGETGAAIYDPTSKIISLYRFDGNAWSSQTINASVNASESADILLNHGTLILTTASLNQVGRVAAWRISGRDIVQVLVPTQFTHGAALSNEMYLQTSVAGDKLIVLVAAGTNSFLKYNLVSLNIDWSSRSLFVRQLRKDDFMNMTHPELSLADPRTVVLTSNNLVSVLNSGPGPRYSHRFRFTGREWLEETKEQYFEGSQIFASGGYEDVALNIATEFSGSMRVRRFNPRDMTWSDTAIVGSAMSDWDLAWKIVFLVMNIVTIPTVFVSGPIGNILLAALDVALAALEFAIDPDQVDVNLGFGEDPIYIISAKSVETNTRYDVEIALYVHNPNTEEWQQAEQFPVTAGNIHGTSALALTDRGLLMETKLIGQNGERRDYFFHTANGVFFNREQISPGIRVTDDRRHVDSGHDIIASNEWYNNANTLRLYRYVNRSWQGPVQIYRVRNVSTSDGYQKTTLRYRYHDGINYPVRFDASAGLVLYNKVTEFVENTVAGEDASGSVETYSYNGFLLPPPNAPSGGNSLYCTSAVTGAAYCTIATGAGGVVSTGKTLHQVYAQEKAGHTEYLALEVCSISETDGVVTSQQVTYDVDVSGNPRESRSFVGLPDLSSEHQASRTTYAHEIPAYGGLKAKGFLDGPARLESEVRNAIPSTVQKQFTTSWGIGFNTKGNLDLTAPFQVAEGTFTTQSQNRSFNLYKTTAGAVTHVCSDFRKDGTIVNAGFVASSLSGSAPISSTLVGPSGQFPAAVVGCVGRDSTGKGRVEFVYALTAGGMQMKSPVDLPDQPFPKIGLDQQTGRGGRSVFVSGGSKLYRYDIGADGTSNIDVMAAGERDVGTLVQTSPAALRGGGAVVGLLMSETTRGIGCYTVGHTAPVRWTRDVGSYSALTEINALSYDDQNLLASWIIVGGIRGDLLDVIVLDGKDGTEKASLTGLAAARPATIDSLFSWRDPSTGAVTVHALQGESVATLRFTPGPAPALVLVDRTEFVGKPIGSPVIDHEGKLYLAVKANVTGSVVSIGRNGRLAGTFRIDRSDSAPEPTVTAPLAMAGNSIAVLGVTDNPSSTRAILTGINSITPSTPRQVQATTWNTDLLSPVASYAWRGTGSADFAGWTNVPGTDFPDWVRSDAVIYADPASAAPVEMLSTDGVTSSVLPGSAALVPVATFSSGSVRQGTAYFTAFEKYEVKPLGGIFLDNDSYTGRRSLFIPAGVTEITRALNPLGKEAGPLVITAWIKTTAGYRIRLTGVGSNAFADYVGTSTGGAWAKVSFQVTEFIGSTTAGDLLSLAIFNSDPGAQPVALDSIMIAPLGASVQAVVRDPVTFVPVAAIDERGTIIRSINDHFDRPIASVGPDGNLAGMSSTFLSRQRRASDAFDARSPNTVLQLAFYNGGKHWRFGSSSDLDGWTVPSGSWTDQAIKLDPDQQMSWTPSTPIAGSFSRAVRVQIEATGKGTAPTGPILLNAQPVTLRWTSLNGGTLQVTRAGVPDVSVPCPWARDWLIVQLGENDLGLGIPPAMTFYVVADGDIVYTALRNGTADNVTRISISNEAAAGGSAILVRDIALGLNPSASITYADGSGDARQVQSHETVSTVLIQETLYDKTKTARFQTVPTRKRATLPGSAFQTASATSFTFETAFIDGRDPASTTPNAVNLWSTDPTFQNRGSMGGLVQEWRLADGLDITSSFFSYNGVYPNKDPLQRAKEETDSGPDFAVAHAGSVRTSYGREVGFEALFTAAGVSTTDKSRFLAQTLSSPLQHPGPGIPEVRAIARSAQDSLGHLSLAEATSDAPGTVPIRSSSAMSWRIDAGQTIQSRMPNSFVARDATKYRVVTELDRFGRPVTSTGPDRGKSTAVFDDLGRVRFAQDAVGAQTSSGPQFFNYRDYDREGRVTQTGLVVGPNWDAATLQAAATYPAWRAREGVGASWSCDQAQESTNLVDSSGNGLTGTFGGTLANRPQFKEGGPNGLGNCLLFTRSNRNLCRDRGCRLTPASAGSHGLGLDQGRHDDGRRRYHRRRGIERLRLLGVSCCEQESRPRDRHDERCAELRRRPGFDLGARGCARYQCFGADLDQRSDGTTQLQVRVSPARIAVLGARLLGDLPEREEFLLRRLAARRAHLSDLP